MAIRLLKGDRGVMNLMARGLTHYESQQDQPFGVHVNRESHEGFSRSSGSSAVPITGVVIGEPGCINGNQADSGIGRRVTSAR